MNRVHHFLLTAAIACMGTLAYGQETGGSRTIDITSSFKPSLVPPKKIVPNAAPVQGREPRLLLPYSIPAQQVNFRYTPAALKPLVYTDTLLPAEEKGYVKAGFGNFSAPFLQAALHFGDGISSSGNAGVHFSAARGKLPHQQFTRAGASANAVFALNPNHDLHLRGGIEADRLFRYGYRPQSLSFSKEALKLHYNDVHLGATFGNKGEEKFGLTYTAGVDAHFFGDNRDGNESALSYNLLLRKDISEKVQVFVNPSGLLSSVKVPDTSFSNNLTLLKAGTRFLLGENTTVTAALIPSWNQSQFHLLPLALLETYLPGEGFTLELGVNGNYLQNTWRTQAAVNPWIAQPRQMTHSRSMEFFGAIKGNFSPQWFYRLKGGYERRFNVPVYMSDSIDGKSFYLMFEPSANISGVQAELSWQMEHRYAWTNTLNLRGFGGFETVGEAYGLLPLELNSSFSARFFDKLTAKADVFAFGAPWVRENKQAKRGKGGFDLNLGTEFDLRKNIRLWLQFSNILNNTYERWHQYAVLGFQAQGGVVLKF